MTREVVKKVEGRETVFSIANSGSDNVNNQIIEVITMLLDKEPFIYLPDLLIILDADSPMSKGQLSGHKPFTFGRAADPDATEGWPTLQIFIEDILRFVGSPLDMRALVRVLRDTCLHEGFHLVHMLKNKSIIAQKKIRRRVAKRVQKFQLTEKKGEQDIGKLSSNLAHHKIITRDSAEEVVQILRDAALMMRDFIDLLYVEGIANFFTKQYNYVWSDDVFDKSYEGNKRDVDALMRVIASFVIECKDIIEDYTHNKYNSRVSKGETDIKLFIQEFALFSRIMNQTIYSIGPFMVYTIIFATNPENRPDFMHLTSYKFVREYEHACKIKNKRPLITLKSGRGMFDYKTNMKHILIAAEALDRVK